MLIYHYKPSTKEFACASEARLDPMELKVNKIEVPLVPANATLIPVPYLLPNQVAIFNGTWSVMEKVDENFVTPEEADRIEAKRLAAEAEEVLERERKRIKREKKDRINNAMEALKDNDLRSIRIVRELLVDENAWPELIANNKVANELRAEYLAALADDHD